MIQCFDKYFIKELEIHSKKYLLYYLFDMYCRCVYFLANEYKQPITYVYKNEGDLIEDVKVGRGFL